MSRTTEPRIKQTVQISDKEYKSFLKHLPRNIRILVETYKFACDVYATVGLTYYWEELFNLPAQAVYKPERGPAMILLFRYSRYATRKEQWFGHYLPKKLSRELLLLSQDRDGLLFQREKNRKYTVSYISKVFQKTSKKAKEMNLITFPISPGNLRSKPSTDIKYMPGSPREVSEEKEKEILKILTKKAHKAGCPRKVPLNPILETLLAQEDFKYSRSELKEHYPYARAAESQKRRWIKAGIWLKIRRTLIK